MELVLLAKIRTLGTGRRFTHLQESSRDEVVTTYSQLYPSFPYLPLNQVRCAQRVFFVVCSHNIIFIRLTILFQFYVRRFNLCWSITTSRFHVVFRDGKLNSKKTVFDYVPHLCKKIIIKQTRIHSIIKYILSIHLSMTVI